MDNNEQPVTIVPKFVLEEKFIVLHDYEDDDGTRYLQCRQCNEKFEVAVTSRLNMTEAANELHAVCPKCNQHTIDPANTLDSDIIELQKQLSVFFDKHIKDRKDVLLLAHFSPDNQFSLPSFRLCTYGLMGPHDHELLTTFKEEEIKHDSYPHTTGS